MVDILKWLFGQHRTEPAKPLFDNDPDDAPAQPGFPIELLAHHKQIEATRRPILAATQLQGLPEGEAPSQLGGRPWWPADRAYPRDTKGRPLALLIQVNLNDAPVLEDFPERGLIQMFIGQDDLYGANLDTPAKPFGFACIHHADMSGPIRTDFDDIEIDPDTSPLDDPLDAIPLSFARETMLMDPSDHRFHATFSDWSDDDALNDLYAELTEGVPPIRLGGYASFTQTDPRVDGDSLGDVALMTIESTSAVMWGDAGKAQFLIRSDDLAARNFSRVTYHWDCY